MISKAKLVNTLFLAAFPCYGIGSYLMLKQGFSIGLITCMLPFVAILLFYGVDLLYRGGLTPMVSRTYWWCMAFILTSVIAVQMAVRYHSPIVNSGNAPVLMLLFLVPFNASVVVQVYNRERDGFDMAWLVLKGLLLLLGINILGYAAGLHNLLHSFAGRISLPFMMGIYDSAHILAFVNLMLLFYIRDFRQRPLRFIGLSAVYLVDLAVIMSVNSRLSFMIFFLLTVLFVTRAMRALRGVYVVSLFTMPLMMSFALLIYKILSLPFFAALLGRVSKEDVTTFNGRTYIWEDAAKWALDDRRGMLFGNGYNGQYHIRLLDRVAKLWGEPHSYNLHMHSSFLEIVVDQGIVGLVLLYIVFWRGYMYYRGEYLRSTALAPLFAGFVYLLFIWQIDIFCYGIYMGNPLLFALMAPLAIQPRFITGKRKALNGEWLT